VTRKKKNKPAPQPTPPVPRRRSPRRALWLGLTVLALTVLGGSWWIWGRTSEVPVPDPPKIDLTGYDPAIVAVVNQARDELVKSPRSSAAWGRFGMVLRAHNFRDEARHCWEVAERLDPTEPRWPYYLGVFFLEQKPSEALPKFMRAVELCGDDPPCVRLQLAEMLLSEGQLEDAQKHFERIFERHPTDPRARLGLARLKLQRDRPGESLELLSAPGGVAFGKKAFHQLRAQVQQQLGNKEAAEEELRQAADLPKDPAWPDRFLEQVSSLQVGQHGRNQSAARLLDQGQVKEAHMLLEQIVRDYPDSEQGWLLLGKTRLQLHLGAEAEKALRKAEKLAPESPDVQCHLGVALLQQDQHQAARTHLSKAIELKPDYAEAYYCLARCLVKAGDRPAAIEALRSAVRHKPQFGDAHLFLGELLVQAGDYTEALTPLQDALRLKPNDERAKQFLELAKQHQK
jgi:tetratricopeptide (TPR) repeat protein